MNAEIRTPKNGGRTPNTNTPSAFGGPYTKFSMYSAIFTLHLH